LEPLPRESLRRLRQITQRTGETGSVAERAAFAQWITQSIAPRNIAGLADPARRNLYPVDFDALIERHELLGMTRGQLLDALPALRGMRIAPPFPLAAATLPRHSTRAQHARSQQLEPDERNS
jgi:hypothetical protein